MFLHPKGGERREGIPAYGQDGRLTQKPLVVVKGSTSRVPSIEIASRNVDDHHYDQLRMLLGKSHSKDCSMKVAWI